MESIKFPIKRKAVILALGAESAGVFAVYKNGTIFISENFGDLLDENNFLKYKKAILSYLKKEGIKPDVILTDLHPLFKTTVFGEELAKKYKIPHIKVQHHIAHIFSAIGDQILTFCHSERSRCGVKNLLRMQDSAHSCEISRFARNDKMIFSSIFFGIAMDGTGYGFDGNIWGGEVFKFKVKSLKLKVMERIGSLEEQIMIGGDLAVREPARMIIAILARIMNHESRIKEKKARIIKSKKDIYNFVKKYYTKNEFELLYNQLEQNFNCQKTTSVGRILDAVSVLLGFAGNERKYKHEATKKLEENSTEPYFLEPQIPFSVIASSPSADGERGNRVFPATSARLLRHSNDYIGIPRNDNRVILQIAPLFEYLIKNIKKDRRRLAATAQFYLARGFYEIIKQNHDLRFLIRDSSFAAGGMANNKIISCYLEKQGVYLSKKISRGDEGIAVGQVVYCLLGLGYN